MDVQDDPADDGAAACEVVHLGRTVGDTQAQAQAQEQASAGASAGACERTCSLALVCGDVPPDCIERIIEELLARADNMMGDAWGVRLVQMCVITAPLDEPAACYAARALARAHRVPTVIMHDTPDAVLRGATHVLHLCASGATDRWGPRLAACVNLAVHTVALDQLRSEDAFCAVQ